jgi:hypothetical protein
MKRGFPNHAVALLAVLLAMPFCPAATLDSERLNVLLIHDPAHRQTLGRLRSQLLDWTEQTGDPALPARLTRN